MSTTQRHIERRGFRHTQVRKAIEHSTPQAIADFSAQPLEQQIFKVLIEAETCLTRTAADERDITALKRLRAVIPQLKQQATPLTAQHSQEPQA